MTNQPASRLEQDANGEFGIPASLRALLSHVIDYAGTFPPARLSLEQAVENYAACRNSGARWILGGLVCAVEDLPKLAPLVRSRGLESLRCCVIARATPVSQQAAAYLSEDLRSAHAFLHAVQERAIGHIDIRLSLEFRLPPDWSTDSSQIPQWFDQINRQSTDLGLPLEEVFLEAPLQDRRTVQQVAQSVGSFLWRTNGFFGVKFRTGGVTAAAVPSSEDLAFAIATCRQVGVSWKATAGLHHPLRRHDEAMGTCVHGFLNVLTAATLNQAKRLSSATIREILLDESPESFHFDDQQLRWRDHSASLEQIEAARKYAMMSFGSCSFEEPLEGLQRLGLMP